MHGTLSIKIFTGQNVATLESTVNTWLVQQNLVSENFVDMKVIAIPGTPPTGVIIVIYRA